MSAKVTTKKDDTTVTRYFHTYLPAGADEVRTANDQANDYVHARRESGAEILEVELETPKPAR